MEHNNKNNIDRKWIAKISCPLCDQVHTVMWPHASFLPPSEMLKFDCPQEKGTIVFSNAATVWAEIVFSQLGLVSDDPVFAERFYG